MCVRASQGFSNIFLTLCARPFSPGWYNQSRLKAPACVRASQDFQISFQRWRARPFSPGWNYQSILKAPSCVMASQGFFKYFFDAGVPSPLVPVGITNRD
jgi:hypothetical protein